MGPTGQVAHAVAVPSANEGRSGVTADFHQGNMGRAYPVADVLSQSLLGVPGAECGRMGRSMWDDLRFGHT
jgi:hypothetical protein